MPFHPGEKAADDKPAISSAAVPPQPAASLYSGIPTGIYETCRQFGIVVPDDANARLEQSKACLMTVFQKIIHPSPEKFMIWPMVGNIASDILEIMASSTAILNILHRDRMINDKLAWHSIYTAILAMGIAKNEKKTSCSMLEIGGAALIHDIGILVLTRGYNDIEIENDPESTGHVAKSVELARKIDATDAAIKMIALHHGRLDGKGFPADLPHSTFDRCSQVLSLANMAELVVCELSFGLQEDEGESSGNSGLGKILHEYRSAYDVDLLKKMISLVGFYPVGSIVELNNRVICKVVGQNPNFPLRPVVQVVMDGTGMHPDEEKQIDLKEVKILSIIRTLASPEIKNIMLK